MHAKKIPAFDAIRAFAALFGIGIHAAAGYLKIPLSEWYHVSPKSSWLFDFIACFFHSFRVPVFFFLAGYFGYLSYQKGASNFVQQRFWRIFVPLLVFSVLLNTPLILAGFALKKIHSYQDLVQLYSLGYLWFLEYLLFYYVFALLGIFLLRKFCRSKIENFNQILRVWLSKRYFMGLLFLISFLALYTDGVWYTPTLMKLIPHFSLLIMYGSFFFLGWVLSQNPDLFTAAIPFKWFMAVTAIILYLSYLFIFIFIPHSELMRFLALIFYVGMGQLLFFSFIRLCHDFFQRPNFILAYIADASYWIYLIHVPIVVYWQYYFAHTGLSIYLQYFFIVMFTLMICLMTYPLVKNTLIGKSSLPKWRKFPFRLPTG